MSFKKMMIERWSSTFGTDTGPELERVGALADARIAELERELQVLRERTEQQFEREALATEREGILRAERDWQKEKHEQRRNQLHEVMKELEMVKTANTLNRTARDTFYDDVQTLRAALESTKRERDGLGKQLTRIREQLDYDHPSVSMLRSLAAPSRSEPATECPDVGPVSGYKCVKEPGHHGPHDRQPAATPSPRERAPGREIVRCERDPFPHLRDTHLPQCKGIWATPPEPKSGSEVGTASDVGGQPGSEVEMKNGTERHCAVHPGKPSVGFGCVECARGFGWLPHSDAQQIDFALDEFAPAHTGKSLPDSVEEAMVTLRQRLAEVRGQLLKLRKAARETPALPAPTSQPERPRPEPVLALEPQTKSAADLAAEAGCKEWNECWAECVEVQQEILDEHRAAAEPAPLEPPREEEFRVLGFEARGLEKPLRVYSHPANGSPGQWYVAFPSSLTERWLGSRFLYVSGYEEAKALVREIAAAVVDGNIDAFHERWEREGTALRAAPPDSREPKK